MPSKRLPLIFALLFSVCIHSAKAQFIISEFMADNVSSLDVDEDDSRQDWLEIVNVGNVSASLNGWYLTDSASNLRKWQFPAVSPAITLAPGEYLVVWCSDKNRKASKSRLHTNFKLGKDGEYLALIRPNGVTPEHQYTPTYPPQLPNGTYGTVLATLQQGYLTSATRGAVNTGINTIVGPGVLDVTDKPPMPAGGAGSAPLLITAKIVATLRPLASTAPVVLKWRRMYDSEAAITMVDNGTSGDVLASDGIFTAQVPTTSLLQGEMIRWRIEARDNGGSPTYSFSPPYPFGNAPQSNPPTPDSLSAEAEQYYGSIATPVYAATPGVPVMHWFLPPGTDNTVNETGTRCSFFWQPLSVDNPGVGYVPPKPRFYDNVLVKLHGQSSATFPKKSIDLGFAKDNKFLWKDGADDSSGLNLLQNYSDKSKVRSSVAWEVWDKSGHVASHYNTLVRVQRNAAFRGLYDMVESGNASFLKREGLDRAGALYKMYNSTENANITTTNSGGVEKKNPDNTDTSDLLALVNGISNSQSYTLRLRYLYDNMDVASVVNLMAVHALLNNRDIGHKNYYLYRDTNGTGEWSPLPWDLDLSLGHTYTGSQFYFDDDIYSQGPIQSAAGHVQSNRILQIIWNTPELNAMFVQRVRTLADQWYISSTETNGPMAQRINAILNQIDPNPDNPSGGNDDADFDMREFGFWVDGSGTAFPHTNGAVLNHTVRAQAARITISNPIPPGEASYAGWNDGGTTSLPPFIIGRRDYLFGTPAPTSSGLSMPASQPLNPTLIIEQINFNPTPVVGNNPITQQFEYFVIRNPNAFSVDLSGWTLSGDINLTFRGGTVLLGQGSATTQTTNSAYINQLIVANKPGTFRTRTTSPMSGEYRQVAGPYSGQLSARGGTIILSRPNDPLNPAAGYTAVVTQPFTGTPTASQNALRVSEINFRPAPATTAELLVLPGLVAGDFEFIELTNTGATTLNLDGAKFDEGIDFTFPAAYTLAPGARCLLVASQTAFEIRYGTGHPIAGEFQGSLDNGGERLSIEDAVGEEVLDFTYDDDWFPVPTGQYRTLVTRTTAPAFSAYSTPTTWALSETQNGTPNTGDTTNSRVFDGWRWDHFTLAEIPTLLNPNTLGALTADPDGDGLNNFAEFAFARLPRTADNPGSLVTAGKVTDAGNSYLSITFRRAKNALDTTYLVEANPNITNPGGWTNVGVFVSATDLGNGVEQVTYRDNTPIGATPRFLRVRAVKP